MFQKHVLRKKEEDIVIERQLQIKKQIVNLLSKCLQVNLELPLQTPFELNEHELIKTIENKIGKDLKSLK